MGLYIQTYAPLPKFKKWPWSKSTPLSEQIKNEAQNWAKSFGITDLFYNYETTATLSHFTFYPLNESLRFEIDKSNVSIGLKTSSVGAGYHAAFIDLCEYLENKVGLKWNWQLSGQESGDETGYAISKNFENLQAQHFEQAATILNHVFSNEDLNGVSVHIHPGLTHDHDENKIIGPRGYIDFMTLSEYQEGEPYEIKTVTDKLFSWQNKNIDEKFWIETLEALLWQEFPWRAATNSHEMYIEKCINSCLEKITQESLPSDLKIAIQEFKLHSQKDLAPIPTGIGYKKRTLYTDISGPWRCSIPGYFKITFESENSTCLFNFDEIAYRVSSLVVERKDDKQENLWPEFLEDSLEFNRKNFSYRLPAELDNEGEGWYHGMGIGMTPISNKMQHMIMFSVTAKSEEIVFNHLRDQFENGIHFKGTV
jgi:hypothetical protein